MGTNPDAKQEAQRLKAVAENKYKNSNLKSALKHVKKAHRLFPNLHGVSSMLTAFKILRAAAPETEWYKILQVEPFSHINSIKKQYKKLALILHPDKNPYPGCEEAFKLVGEGFRVFSDKIRRKEYDMKLRIRIQEERTNDGLDGNGLVGETFWTSCSRCRLLHKFERKYLGHNLVCPSCKKSFLAEEVDGEGSKSESTEDDEEVALIRVSERLKRKRNLKEKTDNVKSFGSGGKGDGVRIRSKGSENLNKKINSGNCDTGKDQSGNELGITRLRRRMSTVGEVLERSVAGKVGHAQKEERSKSKRVKVTDEKMTLAQMQLEIKRKANQGRSKFNVKEKVKDIVEKEKEIAVETERTEPPKGIVSNIEKQKASKNNSDYGIESHGPSETSGNLGMITRSAKKKSFDLEAMSEEDGKKNQSSELTKQVTSRKRVKLNIDKRHGLKDGDQEIKAVEDSDFHDFNKDRMERKFRKGQVWAIYDDDGMPRLYGLIEEVFSVNPFEVKMSWLDLQNNVEDRLITWQKRGFHVSCGKFKTARSCSIKSVNKFSHMVECERAARELYRIYPKKGSVWAVYKEANSSEVGRNLSAKGRHCYDIVVFLTTYSEIHGLSMAYLEKVDGFKTIFKRQEIGCQAIRWLEKDDICLFSHQIPAWKLSGDDVPDILKDCWELDSAALPWDLLAICCET